MNPEHIYLENLPTIERVAAHVARRNHLRVDEAEDFVQEVCLRLMADDYAVIRKFEGRSLFATYLTTVIGRIYHQLRVEMWGKWRPSAKARQLGDKAITLERLLTRDNLTFDEAVKELTTPSGSQFTAAELEAIHLRLPRRTPRPRLVAEDTIPDIAAVEDEDPVERQDRECARRKVNAEVDRLMDSMDAEDRLILQMRFWHEVKVTDIARRLQIDQKKLYKRLDRLFGAMRRELERAGFQKSDLASLLGEGDQEIRFQFLKKGGETRPFRPSHKADADGKKGGKGGGSR